LEVGMSYVTVSETARRIDAKPRDISDLFYNRLLRDDLAPIVGGRRLIPDSYVETIRLVLVKNGRPAKQQEVSCVA
jgi:hypothetical protein